MGEEVTGSEWRELVFDKLTGLETQLSRMAEQLTELRVNAVSQRNIETIESRLESQSQRIQDLENTRSRAWGIVIGIQGAMAVAWVLFEKFALK